jgi:hypothetical protein
VSIENDTLTQSSRAISRGRELYLTPPEPEDEICPRCLRDTEDHAYGAMGVCRKCALCGGYGECRYSDCGAEEAFVRPAGPMSSWRARKSSTSKMAATRIGGSTDELHARVPGLPPRLEEHRGRRPLARLLPAP